MREFWMRLMSAVVIVGLILGYNSVLEARAKDEEIAKLNAKIENTESLEDEDSKNGSYKDGTYTGEADGFGGTVKVEVIVKKQKIKEVNIVSADGEDGSYLTMQESASGTSQNEDAKGQYIMLGECSITKAGRNRIYVYSGTTARTTVNLVSTIIYVDRYNAEKDAWGQIAGWSKDAENDYFVSTSKYITVEPGYYYRVRADHFAGMQYPYESTYSFTDGIMIK